MCGLAGILDLREEAPKLFPELLPMLSTLTHRGNDDSSTIETDSYAVGFQRLSINDLQNGRQPMLNETGSIISVCNGEIFNSPELRLDLADRGHQLISHSDCEVIPHLYEEMGESLPLSLNGQFAFAVYDKDKQHLLLGRDHFGIAPLYYTIKDNVFLFASEIKALLAHPQVTPKLDIEALQQVMLYPGIISPKTMFKGIHSLPAGHTLSITKAAKQPSIKHYWDLNFGQENYELSPRETLECLDELLTKSVRRRLLSDVPIGLYLSGGLDSSLLGAYVSELTDSVSASFSVDFLESTLSEREYQNQISKHLQTTHQAVLVDQSDIAREITQVIRHCECPLKETFNVAALMLSRQVHDRDLKVVIGGQGADELFGGYIGYRVDNFSPTTANTPSPQEQAHNDSLWGNPLFTYERPPLGHHLQTLQLFSSDAQSHLCGSPIKPYLPMRQSQLTRLNNFQRRTYLDFKLRLADHLLGDHGDRMSFANSVEARFPFLDQELVNFALTIPSTYHYEGHDEKILLKKLALNRVPSSIINREKFGFAAPGIQTLIQSKVPIVMDYLSGKRVKESGVFNATEVEKLKSRYSKADFSLNIPFDIDYLAVIFTYLIFEDEFRVSTL